ncbi:MAG TPA: alpha-amylase family glycosyl hydrolase [Bacteroidales bacterium]|nr:alpha-amylase family glycosyl hydrolase [Bacteroidales bacterium]HRZ21497.1 alpha-amylase family glycosyl hydrolase [Bacteroidales bacterium]
MKNNDQEFKTLIECWEELYPDRPTTGLSDFFDRLRELKNRMSLPAHSPGWYKDVIVYSLYVDLFNKDFSGLESKLDYLVRLGVNCLWLLPILDSPMRDAGFDIRDYRTIRADLLGLPEDAVQKDKMDVFKRFLQHAREKNIHVIFDIALNHTSDEHPWFREARKSADNPYREYYIWSRDDQRFKDARIIFKGLCASNWEKDGEEYYFHRFFEFQPDLNFRNPVVLLEMAGHLLYWLEIGVDGFRADAIPYIWKEEGTACENLPQTHTVIRFLRAVLDYARPDTLLLAEACQKPHLVVEYFGRGDECNAGYHFPLMPQIYKAVAMENGLPVKHTLSPEVTPDIPGNSQWFTFLRCHDEVSLELVYVTEEDRKFIHDHYCKKPQWDFRQGQGISARLSELMDRDPRKIGMIFSIMLTLPGTPVIYYGDEFGKTNDEAYYHEMIRLSGKDDTRFLVRGKIGWEELDRHLRDNTSMEYRVFDHVSRMVTIRRAYQCFGRGDLVWMESRLQDGALASGILSYVRSYHEEKVLVIHNLSGAGCIIAMPEGIRPDQTIDLLGHRLTKGETGHILQLDPYDYFWIDLTNRNL